MNSSPAIVMRWRCLIPVYVPLPGVVGLIYFAILMAVGLAKTLLVMVAEGLVCSAPCCLRDGIMLAWIGEPDAGLRRA